MQKRILVVSDIHYACSAEQARRDHEFRAIKNPIVRNLLRFYRSYFWLRDPYGQNHLLDQILAEAGSPDFVVANGDYSCNTAFIGMGDDAACQSGRECLGKLREKFGAKFRPVIGDHELGKFSLIGRHGGLRLTSWNRTTNDLGIPPFWTFTIGNYVLVGVTSTVVALPVFEPEILPEERMEWQRLREQHLEQIRQAFAGLKPSQKVLLFCHDPTALPFLWRENAVQEKTPQIEQTIIGHLHSPLLFWNSKILSGMPRINFMGSSIRRYSTALNEARHWRPFKVTLCPSPPGIELLKDGGYLNIHLEEEATRPVRIERKFIKR